MPRFTVHVSPETKAKLDREAFVHKRSVSAEAGLRLEESFKHNPTTPTLSERAESPAPPPYIKGAMTKQQQELLELFNAMPSGQQLALLTLLRR